MAHSRFRSRIVATVASVAAMMLGSAFAGELRLNMDQVKLVRTKIPFKTVSVGNALIADVTAIDENNVLVFAKEFGTTNLIAVDAEGNLVAEEQITVTTQRGHMITLQRGNTWSTLTCNAERCDVRPTPGDEFKRYSEEANEINAREQQGVTAGNVK